MPELGLLNPRPEPSIIQYTRVAIDTSKAVFTLHGVDDRGRPVLRTDLRRPKLLSFFARLPATEIVLEACGGSHHWARELGALAMRCG